MKKLVSMLAVATLAASLGVSGAPARTAKTQNLVQTAVAAGQFKTLTKLLRQTGLARTLGRPGPYTVFAPTDAAFKKLPQRTLNLLARDKAKLRAVLLYHVVAGKVTGARVVRLASARTLNGKSVRIRVVGSNVLINGAKVTKPDVVASNGVIHVINRVLIPPTQ